MCSFLSWNFAAYVLSGIILGVLILDTQVAVLAFFQIFITFLGCVSVSVFAGRTIMWLILAGITMMSVAFSPTMGTSAYLMGGLIGYNLLITANAAHKLMNAHPPLRSLQILTDNAIAGLSLGWLMSWLMGWLMG